MRCAYLLAMTCLFGSAWAAPPWPQEPKTFLGVELGAPYRDGTLPACPESSWAVSELCARPFFGGIAELRGISIPDVTAGSIQLWDGDVSSMTLSFPTSAYADMRRLLVAKYGDPTNEKTTDVRTRLGATFSSQEASWVGARVSILLLQRGAKVDTGGIVVTYEPAARAERRAKDEALRDAASKL